MFSGILSIFINLGGWEVSILPMENEVFTPNLLYGFERYSKKSVIILYKRFSINIINEQNLIR